METQDNLIFIDDLTGLYNRRYLFSRLPKYLQEAQANKDKLWLFMLDIDNFKIINDTYGHLSGDELIRDVSAVLKENTKTHDKRIRYAGDEFTIILPGIDLDTVLNIAKRLVAKVDSHRFKEKHTSREMHITISVGIAGYPQDTSDPTELINLADKALYISKQKGRNCVSVVSEIKPELFWKKELFERFPCSVLVGRSDQSRKLNEALKQSMQSVTNFLLITGEAGVGKSRLINEFEKSIPNQEVAILMVRCEERFLHQLFYALGNPLNTYLLNLNRIPLEYLEGMSEPERSALAKFLPPLRDIIKTYQLSKVAAHERDNLSFALYRLFLNISKIKPLCLIIDDMQYIDEKSLGVITRIVREDRDTRMMFLAAYSERDLSLPEMAESSLAAVIKTEEFQKHAQTISLSALDQQGINVIISNLLLSIPLAPDFSSIIYKKTKGNPLFTEELLKCLIEKEIVCFKDGKWQQQAISEANLPSSIEEAIKSRLEDLDEETRKMIAKAAVIGDDFQLDILQKIDSEDMGYILDLIESVKKIGLIDEKEVKGKEEFSFTPGEIRNILFDVIGGEQTRHLYSRLGEIKEKLYPDKLNSIAGELYHDFKKADNKTHAEQYSKLAKENWGEFYDRTLDYAQSLIEGAAQEKEAAPLSKDKAGATIPALIRNICTAASNYVLYPAQNKVRINSIQDVYEKIFNILMETEIISIAIVESTVVVNNKKLGKELSVLFTDSFVTVLRNLNIKSIVFQRGVELAEIDAFIGILSATEPPESIAEILERENIRHIQINEITYDILNKKPKEKEHLEESMLIDYLMGKLPQTDANKTDLAKAFTERAPEIAKALEKMGEDANVGADQDKDAAKAEIIAKSIEKLGKQFLERGDEWSKYKEGLVKALLSMDPNLRSDIFSSQLDARGKDGIDIMKELSLGLPDDTIVDMLSRQYAEKNTDLAKIKSMVQRFLSSPEKKARLSSVLREKLKQMGASDEECEWIFEDRVWEKLSLEDKVKKISQSSMATFAKMLPLIQLAPLIKELILTNQEAEIEIIENKFIIAWQEEAITWEVCANNLKEILNVFIQDSPGKLFPKFIQKLLKIYGENPAFIHVFFACLNPSLDRIANVLINNGRISLMKEVMQVYSKDAKNMQNLERVLEPITIKLVEELIRRIDGNLSWGDLLEAFIFLKDQAVKPLIERALFEQGVPEGKYFEAYLRRRTIGKLLTQIPQDDLLRALKTEKFINSPSYIIKNLIEIIGAMENENAVALLEGPLDNSDIVIRRKVIFTLSKMKGEASARLLGLVLKNRDIKFAQEALAALHDRKDQFAASMLKQAAQDQNLASEIRKNI